MDLRLAIEANDMLTVFLRDGEAQASVAVHPAAATWVHDRLRAEIARIGLPSGA